ncbi:hypothetical protein JCM11251_004959 [Rhodosporidiobolus azoricus]
MQGRRRDRDVLYTIPDEFVALEHDFRAQTKRINSAKRASGSTGRHATRAHLGKGEDLSSGSETAAQEDDEDAEVDQLASSDLEDAATKDELSRKKRKGMGGVVDGNGKNTDGKKNGKDRLTKLPKEVLVEIFTSLPFPSLFSLSRCNKRLHSILLAPSSTKLWTSQRRRLGLPDLPVSEMSEEGYAELVYGRRCMACGKAASRMPDCFMRLRWCRSCKNMRLVRLNHLAKTHPELHLAAGLCVLRSSQSLSQPNHLALLAHWAPLRALEAHSDALWRLQERDDAENEAKIAMAFALKHEAAMNGRVSKSRRHGESREDEDEGEAPEGADDSGVGLYAYSALGMGDGEMGKNVKRYVKKRRAMLDPLEEEGKKFFNAVKKLVDEEAHDTERKTQRKKQTEKEPYLHSERRTEYVSLPLPLSGALKLPSRLERRVLALGDGFTADNFESELWQKSKTVNEGGCAVDDEEFASIKPKLLKILRNIEARSSLEAYHTSQLARQQALRPFFDQHRAKRTFYPLFADFLQLPSVAALWQVQDGTVDSTSFSTALPALEADMEEWVVDTRLAAIFLILTRTLEIPEDEELDSDADAYETYGEDWLALLSSCLICPLKGCYEPPSAGKRGRPTFYGTLSDLFEHQHEVHGDTLALPLPVKAPKKDEDGKVEPTEKSKKDVAPPPALYHFSLPLEVASAADALTDLLAKDIKAMRRRNEESRSVDDDDDELDEEDEPTIEEVDELFEENEEWKLRWWDGVKPKGSGEREWRKVFCHIKREAERAFKAKPPRVVLPCLGFKSVERSKSRRIRLCSAP